MVNYPQVEDCFEEVTAFYLSDECSKSILLLEIVPRPELEAPATF